MRSFFDPNHKYSTQLLTAVLDRDINAVHHLLRKGAKANVICGVDGHTAIGMAAALGENEILRLLIQSCDERNSIAPICSFEADNNENTPEGMDDLEWDDEFPLSVNDTVKANSTETDEHTTLYHYYAKTLEVTGSILNSIKVGFYAKDKQKEDANTADETLMTPLHYAAAYGHGECVDILLANGCKVNAENAEGFTPLHLGTKFYDITLKLLQYGADPTLHSLNSFETPLHMAVRHRNIDVVQLLLHHNRCQIDAVNSDDRTPLINAIRSGVDEIAMILLDNNAKINLADKKGRTALYYAVTRNKLEIAKRLLLSRARRFPEHYLLHNCVRMNYKEMVELLILHGMQNMEPCETWLNMRNPDGLTPIILAIACRNAEMLEFLLELSAKLNKNSKAGEISYLGSELFMAVECTYYVKDFEPLAKVLFAYTTTKLQSAQNGFLSFCECFDNFCSTPLAHAIEQNKLPIAEFLIKEGIDGSLACSQHNLLHLSQLVGEPGVLEFTRFLVYAGFKFKYQSTPHRCFWTPEQAAYELEVLDLCKNPLSLKVLSRLVIRRCLTQKPFGNHKYSTMCSPMLSRIKELELPKSLQAYIYEFPDCHMNFKAKQTECNLGTALFSDILKADFVAQSKKALNEYAAWNK